MATDYTEALRDDTVRLAEALAEEKEHEAHALRDIASNAKYAQLNKLRNKVASYAGNAEVNFLEGKKLSVLVDHLKKPSSYGFKEMGTTDTVPCSLSFDGEVWELYLPLACSVSNSQAARNVGRWHGYLVKNLFETYKESGEEIRKLKRPVVVFNYCLSEDRPLARLFDADNRDSKKIIDSMTGILYSDDSVLDITTMHFGTIESEECTRVYVMEDEIFPSWIAKSLIDFRRYPLVDKRV